MTNDGQLGMLKNMLNSAEKAGIPLDLFHIHHIANPLTTYGSIDFKKITMKKFELILAHSFHDSQVLWVDNDIVFFRNPIDELVRCDGDFVMQDDIWSPCTGFFLMRSSQRSRNVLHKSIELLKSSPNDNVNDQTAFNTIYRTTFPRIRVRLLPRKTYPNGEIYFERKETVNPFIVHNNYLTNTPDKIARFKEHGLWNDSDETYNKNELKKTYES